MKPKLAIHTTFYNTSQFIERCIASVIDNDCPEEVEWVMLDDCSTDDSFEKVVKWTMRDRRIKLLRNDKNQGKANSAYNINKMVVHSKAPYIFFLDSDDYLGETFLKDILELIRQEHEIIYIGLLWEDIEGNELRRSIRQLPIFHRKYLIERQQKGAHGSDIDSQIDVFKGIKGTTYNKYNYHYTRWEGSLTMKNGLNDIMGVPIK